MREKQHSKSLATFISKQRFAPFPDAATILFGGVNNVRDVVATLREYGRCYRWFLSNTDKIQQTTGHGPKSEAKRRSLLNENKVSETSLEHYRHKLERYGQEHLREEVELFLQREFFERRRSESLRRRRR